MENLSFKADLTGCINNQTFTVTGKGKVNGNIGLTDGIYEFSSLPKGFDPMLLSAFLVCGYPNAVASIDGTPNLFRGHSYEYRRSFKLRDGGELYCRTQIKLKGNSIKTKFHLTGWCNVPELVDMEPVVESWEPYGEGGLRGHFTISFKTKDGSLITGDTFTNYQIDANKSQVGVLHRFIIMKTIIKGKSLREIQTEGLFHHLPKSLWIKDAKELKDIEKLFSETK